MTTWKKNSLFALATILMLLGSSIGSAADSRNSFDKINGDFVAGNIGRTEMLFEQMKALFAPQDLASEYKSTSPELIKSGTGLIMEVLDNWDEFDADQQNLMAGYMAAPIMESQFDSPGGMFKIHYDTTPPESVPPQDLNGNAIPDYVERMAEYCDSASRAYEAMGYLPAPTDSESGGDERYDIYLVSISAYGLTIPDGPGDSAWEDSKSYIWVHHAFNMPWLPENDDPEGDTIGAQKVTCAHEYFHAVQLAYVYDQAEFLWMMESTATWMEEVVFPEVNDNYNYLSGFFDKPHVSLAGNDIYHNYGALVWGAFLHQRFDYTAIRRAWEAGRYNLSLDATDSALAYFGTDLMHTISEFQLWNYYTADRAIPGMYYADAADYPMVNIDQNFSTLIHDSLQPIDAPDGLGCNYVQFEVDDSAFGILQIGLDGSDLVRWANSAIVSGSGDDLTSIEISDGLQPIYIYIPFIEDYNTVITVPAVISRYLEDNNYYLSNAIIPYGDANYDTATNVGDAVYIINMVFSGGPGPKPIYETGDSNCDGSVNIADAVTIINYVYKNGDAPCANRIPE
jgi:hypothetical protein